MKTVVQFLLISILFSTSVFTVAESNSELYKKRVIDLLPSTNMPKGESSDDRTYKEYMAIAPDDTLYIYGDRICRALIAGRSKKSILDENFYLFWGVVISDAMYFAALDVICPEMKAMDH